MRDQETIIVLVLLAFNFIHPWLQYSHYLYRSYDSRTLQLLLSHQMADENQTEVISVTETLILQYGEKL